MRTFENAEILRWIEGCREGNRRAQYQLFRHFYSKMFGICMRYAGSREEAEDMLNEGFMKVFSNIVKYENTGSFESWMARVMVNAALDYRRKYIPKVTMAELTEIEDCAEIGAGVNAAIDRLSAEAVTLLIQQLPPATRTVFNLFAFEGYSHAEIATRLGMSEGTSAWHVNAARTRLKKEILKMNNL